MISTRHSIDSKTLRYFLSPGTLFATNKAYEVTTVLGSCISICIWDTNLKIGGMNHYLLPLWSGEGLATPKYGNVAIVKLIEKMIAIGSEKKNLQAKMFGGTSNKGSSMLSIGKRNIAIARHTLKEHKIPIVISQTGGFNGRKIIFNTATGGVKLKVLKKTRLNYGKI